MIVKIRPNARVYLNQGTDGRDAFYDIEYRCPKCHKIINYYKAETACDKCGTFYDWSGNPHIVTTRTVEWE